MLDNRLDIVVADDWTRNSLGLAGFEFIVLCLLFELFAWFSLGLQPAQVIGPMFWCAGAVSLATLVAGAYRRSCFESIPKMYTRGGIGFVVATLVCMALISSEFPLLNDVRFKFAFLFASVIVLMTTRSLLCGLVAHTARQGRSERRVVD